MQELKDNCFLVLTIMYSTNTADLNYKESLEFSMDPHLSILAIILQKIVMSFRISFHYDPLLFDSAERSGESKYEL